MPLYSTAETPGITQLRTGTSQDLRARHQRAVLHDPTASDCVRRASGGDSR